MPNEQIIPRKGSRENRLRMGRAQSELGTDLSRFATLQELRSRDLKANVRLVTVASLAAYTAAADSVDSVRTLTADANGALSIDGTAVAAGDRILLKNGASGSDNGIYDVIRAGSVSTTYQLKRAVDADSSAEVTPGMTVFVAEGSTKADTWWTLTNNSVTLDTTSLVFAETSGAGFATYATLALTTNGNGASLIGIEDALSKITAATVEGALAEIAPLRIGPTAVAAAADRVTGGTEQVFASSLVIPANAAGTAGKKIRGRITLAYSGVNGMDTTTVALKAGGVDILVAAGLDPDTNADFITIDIEIDVITAGASGVAHMKFTITLWDGTSGAAIGTPAIVTNPLQAYDTTAAMTFTVGNTFSDPNAGNTMEWRAAGATVGFI